MHLGLERSSLMISPLMPSHQLLAPSCLFIGIDNLKTVTSSFKKKLSMLVVAHKSMQLSLLVCIAPMDL